MTDDDRLHKLLRTALPGVSDEGPSRDLWPPVASRIDPYAGRVPRSGPGGVMSWFDLGVAAAVAVVLMLFPEWLFLLLYHL